MEATPAYGQTRQKRGDVTYSQIERAATEVLRTGTRPTVALITQALGGGSARTITDGLNRYWRDLGNQVAGSPDTVLRLPAAVADLAEGLWHRALILASDAAQVSGSEAAAQLSKLKNQLEVQAHTLSQREIELDELLRARERTVKELEEHLRAAMSLLTKRDVAIASLETRLAATLQETESYRQRLAGVIQRAVLRHQRAAPKPVAKPKKPVQLPKRPVRKKPKRRRGPRKRVKHR